MNEPRLLERQITNNQMPTLTLNVIFVLTLLRTRSLVSVGTYFGEKVESLIFGFTVVSWFSKTRIQLPLECIFTLTKTSLFFFF